MVGSGKQEVAVINVLISVYCLTIGLHIQQVEFNVYRMFFKQIFTAKLNLTQDDCDHFTVEPRKW